MLGFDHQTLVLVEVAHICPACTVSVGVALFLNLDCHIRTIYMLWTNEGHSATQQCDSIVDCSLCASCKGNKDEGASARVMGLCNFFSRTRFM